MKKNLLNLLLTITFLVGTFSTANASHWLQQRWQFKVIQESMSKMDLNTFEPLVATLQDYPIAHYLRYFYLSSHLKEKEIATTLPAFLKQYKDTPFAKSLRQAWLKKLAKAGDWETFITAYTPQKSATLQCYYLQAHLHTQEHLENFLQQAKDLWRVAYSQPKACDPIFDYLYDNEFVTEELRWQRIRLAMKKGQLGLARYLAKKLPKTDQKKLTYWQSLYKKPALVLKNFKESDTPLAREMLLQGLRRLAYRKVATAHHYWQTYQKRYRFADQEKTTLSRYIALKGANQNLPEAVDWLAKVDKNFTDDQVNHAKLKVLLAQQDWQAVIKLIKSFPVAIQDKHRFKYWLARALKAIGKQHDAEKQFQALVPHREYYGFLAAEELGKAYSFQPKVLKITQEQKDHLLEKQIGLIRARELYFLGFDLFARVEWHRVLPRLTKEELKIAARLAYDWGWYDRAIITIAQAKYYDALEIRFPLPFYDTVLKAARLQQLEFAYVYAVMRQESLFQTDAVSVAGARGLMQLMRPTARQVAKRQKITFKKVNELFIPHLNIKLGTTYLRNLLNRFDNNLLLAAAAYNAGPSNVKKWRRQNPCLPADIWVELIPFNETRDYVQRVLSYKLVFEYQMVGHQAVKPMSLDDKILVTEKCSH